MISPEEFWPNLESLGEAEVRKRLAQGVYGAENTPVVREWLATKERARQENQQGRSFELAEQSNSIASEANSISRRSNTIAWVALAGSFLGLLVSGFALSRAETPRVAAPVDVTVYPMMKIAEGPPTSVGIAIYRVDVPRQTVMYWRPGIVESPENLANCAVRDAENWRCEHKVGDFAKAIVEMQNGTYQESADAGAMKWYGVTREQWEETRQREQRR